MSAYAHQLEQQFSGLSSRGNSELGSRYAMESGFYMTSFAATIFLASLLAVGVLMVTLLIALSAMLQNCESRSCGIVEVQKLAESFSYCEVLALHAQLNALEATELPSIFCRDVAIHRIKQGVYLRELNFTVQMALTYFGSITPLDDHRDAVLIDIDEILALKQLDHSYFMFQSEQDGYRKYIEEAEHQKHKLTLELHSKLRSQGYSIFLSSRKSERERNATVEQLKSAGYSDWSRLIMRADAEMQDDKREYLRKQSEAMEERGYRVKGVVGNNIDVLTVLRPGMRLFKLPSIVYYRFDDYNGSRATGTS